MKNNFIQKIKSIFNREINVQKNLIFFENDSLFENQNQTNDVFSEKWNSYEKSDEKSKLDQFQKEWYLKLYGFKSENELKKYLEKCDIIIDAGCGMGNKTFWFADLSPKSLVIGIDFSESVINASNNYINSPNLFFVRGDISNTNIKDSSIDYVNCDQVIMHTENPEKTFEELTRICNNNREVACYFYAKKALPRELLDEYFREKCKTLNKDELWKLSSQLTDLGKTLSELNINIDVPDIPSLNIKGGNYDLQRFIYWNFIKCFWNEKLGPETSTVTNFDWYSPSNAKRFSENDVKNIISKNKLLNIYFNSENACYSGRFLKK